MGEPISGAWARTRQAAVGYSGARRWGNGINAVHYHRGETGRPQNARLTANQMGDFTEAAIGKDDIINASWGYTLEDIAGADVFTQTAFTGMTFVQDGWPSWEPEGFTNAGGENTPPAGGASAPDGFNTPVTRGSIPNFARRPWNMTGAAKNRLRGYRAGARDLDSEVSNQIPTETVNEGWLNKAASGMGDGEIPDDNVMPSAVAQYERNTSMQQRHKTTDNSRSVGRSTDDPRSSIPSRIAPMKLKVFSGEERHYDMFPYQMDDMPRAFTYRTAGTGPASYLLSNDQHNRQALQRTPPADPSQGIPDTELSDETAYGYSGEDQGYY